MNKINYNDFFKVAYKYELRNIQITEEQYIYTKAKIINSKLLYEESGDNTFYTIQADYQDSTVKIDTNYIDVKIIPLIIEKAKFLKFPKTEIIKDTSKNNKPEKIVLENIDKDIKQIINLNKYIKNEWILKTEILLNYALVRIINDLGVDISSSIKNNEIDIELTIKENNIIKNNSRHVLFKGNELDYQKLLLDLIEETKIAVNKAKITSGKYNVLFKGNVVNKILSELPRAINKRNINDKTSFLTDKLDKQIFSKNININEYPLDNSMPGFRTFDDEGTPTVNKKIIENGKLVTYLYDKKCATEENVKPTGNNFGSINTRNLVLEGDHFSYQELVNKLDNGIIVYNVASSFSVDVSKSDISMQCFGLLVKNGKIVGGLKPFILSTSYFDFFNNITTLGNDLCFNNISCFAPSVIVHDINIII